jgi:4-amino-4-deoxy-L-arabinose transferase-like glycosyltransferase
VQIPQGHVDDLFTSNDPSPDSNGVISGLRGSDALLLFIFALAVFGYSMISGRPLSLHEARLPEVSREMMQHGDWLIPRSGGRPWLERPPLPHWITIGASAILGKHCDAVWVVRLPAAIAGAITVILAAWIAGRLFGRWTGVASALILTTSYEFWTYSGLAEDDIFLAPIVAGAIALFVRLEFSTESSKHRWIGFVGRRPWEVLAFFALLGLTNFVKGPLVGAAVVIATVGGCLIWNRDRAAILRYVWLWGWIVFGVIAAFWPLAVYSRFKQEIIDNWKHDYVGTSKYDEHFWYYPVQILGAMIPWTPAALIALWKSFQGRHSLSKAVRFLLCWAILPIIVLSIPHRKHHHYLVPSLAPWAILAAMGVNEIGRSMFAGPLWSRKPAFGLAVVGAPGAIAILALHSKIPGPFCLTAFLAVAWFIATGMFYLGLLRQSGRLVMGSFVGGLVIALCWGQSNIPDLTTKDTAFLRRVANKTASDPIPLYVDADLHGELDFFRNQFYLGDRAQLLHNLTFLRDEHITSPTVYLVTREWNAPKLEALGVAEVIDASERSRPSSHAKQQAKLNQDRFTLYRVTFYPDLKRYPAPMHITTMQAMGRAEGPYCGPKLVER